MPSPSASLADYIWLHMGSIFGHKWTSSMGDNPLGSAGRVWATTLAGMDRSQIDAGLAACRSGSDEWPPTLPAFKAMCLQIPPLAKVRFDTDQQDPFTVLVWQFLDGYRYRCASQDQADRLLRDAYRLAREHVMQGGELPAVALQIAEEKKPHKPASAEEALAAIARIRAALA